MSHHIVDERTGTDDSRLKRYIAIEKRGEDGSSKAVRILHSRPALREDASRLREYTRIERGETA